MILEPVTAQNNDMQRSHTFDARTQSGIPTVKAIVKHRPMRPGLC